MSAGGSKITKSTATFMGVLQSTVMQKLTTPSSGAMLGCYGCEAQEPVDDRNIALHSGLTDT
jgi:hypothetical protein